ANLHRSSTDELVGDQLYPGSCIGQVSGTPRMWPTGGLSGRLVTSARHLPDPIHSDPRHSAPAPPTPYASTRGRRRGAVVSLGFEHLRDDGEVDGIARLMTSDSETSMAWTHSLTRR